MQTIQAKQLISDNLFAFSKDLFDLDPVVDIYIHASGGSVVIGGGTYGSQSILSLPFGSADLRFLQDVVASLDHRLELDFRFVNDPQSCNIAIYLDAKMEINGGSNTLGLAIPNTQRRRNWWELILNNDQFSGDQAYLRYALIHELAHCLGLEHPFDGSDGDAVNGITDPWRSVFPDDTVMAYRTPRSGAWPQAYTANDWLALEQLWGKETTPQVMAPLAIRASRTQLPENTLPQTVVATISSTDPNETDSHRYALVKGDGDSDNHLFQIDGDRLLILETTDYERRRSYSIRLRTTDSSGLSFEQVLLLSVDDLDEVPPSAPLLDLASESDSGGSNSDHITAVAQPMLRGRAEPGSTLTLIRADQPERELGQTQTASDGSWWLRLNQPLSDGRHSLSARARDVAGNLSGQASPLILTIDTTTPRLTATSVPSDGTSIWSRQLKADKPVVWSVSEGRDKARFDLSATGLLRLLDDRWTIDDDRSLAVTVTATDLAGNSSSLALSITLEPTSLALPLRSAGSTLLFSGQPSSVHTVHSLGSPDLITIDKATNVHLELSASERWGRGFVARNLGSPTSPGTGEALELEGLGRYACVTRATMDGAMVSIELDPTQDSAFFLHDAYTILHPSLAGELRPDNKGLLTTARIHAIDRIIMGGLSGTSIVDLTSPDFAYGGITVLGSTTPGARSVFWGSGGDDTFQGRGSDAVVFTGSGSNSFLLSAGRETLQYIQGGQARDRVLLNGNTLANDPRRFTSGQDVIELWQSPNEPAPPPRISQTGGATLLEWGGNQLLFEGLSLGLDALGIVYRDLNSASSLI